MNSRIVARINITSYISLALLGVYLSVYQSIISSIAKQFEIGNAMLGVIISLHFIGSIAAPIAFGEISDRIGKKPVILVAFGLVVAGIASIYLFENLIVISAGIFLIGCGFAVIEASLSGVLAEANPEHTAKVMNYSQMYFSIGAVAGPLLSLLAGYWFGGWKSTFLFMMIAFTAVAAYLTRLRIGENQTEPGAGTNSVTGSGPASDPGAGLIIMKLVRQRTFIYLCIAIFAYVGIEEGVAFWFGSYFEHASGSTSLSAITLSGYWGSMVVGRYLAGKFHDRDRLFLLGGLLFSFVFVTLALLFQGGLPTAVCFILTGLGFSAVWPMIMTVTAERFPTYTGTAMGAMLTFGAGGGTVVPLAMGAVSKYTGIAAAFYMVPVIILLVVSVLIPIVRQRKTRLKQQFGG